MSKAVPSKQAKDQTAGWIVLLGVCCFVGGLPVIATWIECTLNPGRLQAAIPWATSLLGPYGTQATVDLCCFLTVSALWLASLACGIYYCVLYSRSLSQGVTGCSLEATCMLQANEIVAPEYVPFPDVEPER